MDHFDNFDILCDNQHGFRAKRSCETQLITTVHEIASGLASGSQVDSILLDFSKAFDKVPHARLAHKPLHYYGVRNTTLQWIKSFLSGRKQEVVLEGVHSSQADVTSGVPQGTVLGPLLFLAFINDMPDVVESSSTRLFADDSMLSRPVATVQDQQLLQDDLTRLEAWEKQWQMEFNPGKCVVLRISPNKNTVPLPTPYHLHGQELETVSETKYLGVTFTNHLTWSRHAEITAGKSNRALGFIKRNLRDCPENVRATAYTALVRPITEYASCAWDPHLQKDIKILQKVQKRAARFIKQNCHDT